MADWINKSKIMETIREKCSGLLPEENIKHVYNCVIALAGNWEEIENAYRLVYYWGLLSLVTDIADNHREHYDLLIREDR